MPDLDELRRALRSATEDVEPHITMDRIHRRARGRQRARNAAVAAGVALAVSAVAVPGLALLDGTGPAGNPAATAASDCPAPFVPWLDLPIDTGAGVLGHDVLLGLTGDADDAMFTVAYRDQWTDEVIRWEMTGLPRGAGGGFTAKGETWWFQSSQVLLGANQVLDVGIYSGDAHRITVGSEGHASAATLARDVVNGWTFFWVARTARPLPVDANVGPNEYQGRERLTITAYDPAGQPLHTVTGGFHTGNRVADPPNDAPPLNPSPTPTAPC